MSLIHYKQSDGIICRPRPEISVVIPAAGRRYFLTLRLLFLVSLTLLILVMTSSFLPAARVAFGDTIIQHITVKDGLPNRTVYSSAFDYDHLLWLATAGGLCRSDGQSVTAFKDFSQSFTGILQRDQNGIFLSAALNYPDSVEVFDPQTLQAAGFRLGGAEKGVFAGTSHLADRPLYYARGKAIYVFQPGGTDAKAFDLQQPLQKGDQLLHAGDEAYVLYRHEAHQLERYSVGATMYIAVPTPRSPQKFFRDSKGSIWLSNEAGLYRLTASARNFTRQPDMVGGKMVNFFAEDLQGQLLIGHLNPLMKRMEELVLIDGKEWQPMDWVTAVDDRIITIHGSDFRTDLRLNTYGGLFLIRIPTRGESPFRQYLYRELSPGKFGDVMRGFAADDAGNVYVNKDSRMPYWFRVNAETLTLDTLKMRDNDGTVSDQYGCGTNLLNYQGDIFGHSCDIENDNFRGTVYRYRPTDQTWKKWYLPELHQVVRWVRKGRTPGELFLVTEHKGNQRDGHLYYFYPARDSFQRIQPAGPDDTVHGYTKVVVEDSLRHCLWIGTDMALYRYDWQSERLTSYRMNNAEITPVTEVIVPEAGGDLLLGTLKFGLQNFSPETGAFSTVGGQVIPGEAPPDAETFLALPSNDIAGIRITDQQSLLVFTFNGLLVHWPQNKSTTVYTKADGLNDEEFNTSSIFYNEQDERWYAGGINGFVSFRMQDLMPEESPFQPALLSYRLLDENVGYETIHHVPADWQGPLVLSPSTVYCAFDFSVPDFLPAGEQQYQTYLEGFDLDWNAPTASPTVRYTKLPPGAYEFNLRANDAAGRSTTEIRQVAVWVETPWYNTYLFYLGCVMGCSLLFYGLHLRRMNRLAKELETERRVQSLELRSLRQQLNPHFISNAMNAIRDYIQRADPKDAAKYLTDFSLMMRLFLESSRRRQTSVANEATMLRRYINLEQLRFPGKFEAFIEIDPALDPDMDEVPSLLLQPIVENAINHGLRPLSHGGLLRIEIMLDPEDEEVLICRVTDNGIGRKKASLRPKSSDHISRATQILEDRTTLLAEDNRINLSLKTEDLYPEKENTGTVVTLRIEGC